MRFLLLSTILLAASPAFAERFEASARIDRVTVYPSGADVGRSLRIDLPAGAHELVVPGIPANIDASTLRVSAEGATLGTVNLQFDRAAPAIPAESAEFLAARTELRRLETGLAQFDARLAEIKARGTAAEDMIAFLMKLAESGDISGDFDGLTASARDQLIEARQIIVVTDAEVITAGQNRDDLVRELDRARTRLEALRSPDSPTGALVIALQGQGTPAEIRIHAMAPNANWQSVYDVSLQRKERKLQLDRDLLVTQNTGEDWQNADITLSTAYPLERAAPGELSPNFLAISDRNSRKYSEASVPASPSSDMNSGLPSARAKFAMATQDIVGETVVYHYPTPVTIRSNADALRLPLDSHELTPEIVAEAVPRLETTAYLVADTVNSTGAIILPGDARFFADGALVGRGTLDLTAAGDDMKLGFGPLTGITLERRMPEENQGGRGIIVKSSERTETAALHIRNLTGEEWPLRVIHRVPVSRQEDLKIDWSANPKPDETDPDGKRGLLVWTSPIAPGEERQITLSIKLRWPDGQELISGDTWNAARPEMR